MTITLQTLNDATRIYRVLKSADVLDTKTDALFKGLLCRMAAALAKQVQS